MATIGMTLRGLRTRAGLTQKEVARRLSRQLSPITHQAVSKWETGDAMPSVPQFLALCHLYEVEDVLAVFAPQPGQSALNAEGQAKLREYEALLLASGLYGPAAQPVPAFEAALRKQLATPAAPRTLPLYDLPASAGTGQWLDDDHCRWVEVDEAVPPGADFGVRLAGDSMQPDFADGQVVWARRQPVLEHGQVGLFFYDGAAYCKRFEAEAGGVRLVSLNPAYAPIDIADPAELRVFGRVLG